jgi:NAD/NADP transhydrogenase beta subunit
MYFFHKTKLYLSLLLARLGAFAGKAVATAAVESAAFGGSGALVLGSLTFTPLVAALLGAGVGAICIGSLVLLFSKLWEKSQFKVLAQLIKILKQLNELNMVNQAFIQYMSHSEEEATRILKSMDLFKENVKTENEHNRQVKVGICLQAIDSTNDIIASINRFNCVSLHEWTELNIIALDRAIC